MAADVINLSNRRSRYPEQPKPSDTDILPDTPASPSRSPAERMPAERGADRETVRRRGPTPAQRAWLERGLDQAGGKLPLFDGNGQRVNPRTIDACRKRGWAEPWFANPVKPNWLVCKLTDAGRTVLSRADGPADDSVPD